MQYPDRSINSNETKLLLDILNRRAPASADGIDYERFCKLIMSHGLPALVFCGLRDADSDLRQKIAPSLRPHYLSNIQRNMRLWNEFSTINKTFTESGVDVLPLKGMDILARFYPNFDLRCMCDIDILVKEDQLGAVEMTLVALGYRKNLLGLKEEYWRKKQCAILFQKDGVALDVHWGLDFKRGRREILTGVWDRARQVECGERRIKIFSPEDALFSLALHLRRFGNILILKQVLDAARIIAQTKYFDWDYVLEESCKGRMRATLYFLLTQVALFTDTVVPQGVFERLQLPFLQRWLIRRFLVKYTFLKGASLKTNYLKAHLLLYDSVWEALAYLINIPYEQFCKYYGFRPYTAGSRTLYHLRVFYMPLRHVLGKPVGAVE